MDNKEPNHIDKILSQWYQLNEEMKEYTSKYRDEHWESLIQTHLNNKDDMSDDLYHFLRDELNDVFDRCHLKYNMMNLFELEEDELQKSADRSIDILYNLLTKVVSTIIIFNKMEKYEYSKTLHTMLRDLYILIFSGISIEYVSPRMLRKEFTDLFGNTTEVIMETKYFKDYVGR
jgi:hypothetical protein